MPRNSNQQEELKAAGGRVGQYGRGSSVPKISPKSNPPPTPAHTNLSFPLFPYPHMYPHPVPLSSPEWHTHGSFVPIGVDHADIPRPELVQDVDALRQLGEGDALGVADDEEGPAARPQSLGSLRAEVSVLLLGRSRLWSRRAAVAASATSAAAANAPAVSAGFPDCGARPSSAGCGPPVGLPLGVRGSRGRASSSSSGGGGGPVPRRSHCLCGGLRAGPGTKAAATTIPRQRGNEFGAARGVRIDGGSGGSGHARRRGLLPPGGRPSPPRLFLRACCRRLDTAATPAASATLPAAAATATAAAAATVQGLDADRAPPRRRRRRDFGSPFPAPHRR